MSLSINIGRPFLNDKTLDEQARSVLRLYGTDAHVYLPGANGVAVSGLPTNNYTLSDGSTGYSAVDGTAGLVLDGAGSVGAVTTYDFSSSSGWTLAGSDTISGGSLNFVNNSATFNTVAYTFTAGKTYRIEFDYTHVSGTNLRQPYDGNVANIVTLSASGHYSKLMYCPTTSTTLYTGFGTSANGSIDNLTIAEVTGIHATQATTANKPAVRRGLYNLLTYSNDLSNAAWQLAATASKSGSAVLLPAVADNVYHTSSAPAAQLTVAFILSGTGDVSFWGWNATNATMGATRITLTATPTLYVTAISPTVANSIIQLGRINASDTATSVTFGGAGLFAGTLTAQQILAEGGIPLTTSTAASNPSAGRYSWQFDGTNDQLVCATAPFQIADDFAIVVAVNANTIAGFPGVLAVDDGGSTNAVALYLNSGVPTAYVMAGGTLQAAIAGPAITAGSAYVLSIVKTGSSLKIRKNGVDGTTISTVGVGSAAFNAMRIGYQAIGLAYWIGAIGEPMFIKGTVSASDVLTLERQVASTFPAGPSF